MRSSLWTPFLLATSVLATPVQVETANVRIIENAFTSISLSTRSLSAAVTAITKTRLGEDLFIYERNIAQNALNLGSEVRRNTVQIRTTRFEITNAEALSLNRPFGDLEASTTQMTNAWMSAKSTIVRTQGGREAALRIFDDLESASEDFARAIVEKLPAVGKNIGMSYGVRLTQDYQRAIIAFRF